MMEHIVVINEQQYKDFLLNEEMHYPRFLDELKEEVSNFVYNNIIEKLQNKQTTFVFSEAVTCPYTSEIIFDVKINLDGDVSDKRQYRCQYYNGRDELKQGKINNPKIYVNIPSKNGIILYPFLKIALSHELTHLYDDWVCLSNGKQSINRLRQNVDTTRLLGHSLQTGEPLYKFVSILAYMELKYERQAFLSQTVQELEAIGCNQYNFREALKKTPMYSNLKKGYDGLLDTIYKTDDYDLKRCNDFVMYFSPKANIPKINTGVFSPKDYKNRILTWAERIYHKSMKFYLSIVHYYVERCKENDFKKFGPPKEL